MTNRVAEENIQEFRRRMGLPPRPEVEVQHTVSAWSLLGIDEGMIDWCNKIAEAKRGRGRKYWKSAAGVLRSVENKAYQDLSKPVIEWILKIHTGIRWQRFKQGERQ